MDTRKISAFLAASMVLALAGGAQASDLGKREYNNRCAACHGLEGKGDGPQARLVGAKVADLSTLQKRHNGFFPKQRVHNVIDGREGAGADKPRAMPAWAHRYTAEANMFLPYDPERFAAYSPVEDEREAFVRTRIASLTEYVNQLQKK